LTIPGCSVLFIGRRTQSHFGAGKNHNDVRRGSAKFSDSVVRRISLLRRSSRSESSPLVDGTERIAF
jgi:hypothetical protein